MPKTPGPGIDLDEDALRAHGYEHFRQRSIRQFADEPKRLPRRRSPSQPTLSVAG